MCNTTYIEPNEMADKKPRFIVTEKPKWYYESSYKDVFACATAQGLFHSVADLMVRMQAELSESEQRCNPKTVHKTIRDKVLQNANFIQQKPSVELLRALMDLVDIEGGNGFDCIANVDKAGMKHLLIASGNYTVYYVPQKELNNPTGKKMVIPVVTQCSEIHNLILCDIPRSMVGTYVVAMAQSEKDHGRAYFLQEVLFVPGHKSLELLKVVTCDKYEFWDMALEMPTHLTALVPCFQQILPSHLLHSKINPGTRRTSKVPASYLGKTDPMCCVLETDLGEHAKSLDCLQGDQVTYNLTQFHYKNGGTPTVYCKRNTRSAEGKRVNMLSVVKLRQGQHEIPELYVSTTVRFCRAVKRSCVKGNGEPVSSWKETMQELDRDTFILGPEMHQDIYNTALTAFTKRVNPNSWCNYTPKHIASTIEDSVMVEIVDLAIKFMDSKIPNAFAVAELLYCPMKKVREYQRFWSMYISDKLVNTVVKKKHYNMIKAQMTMDWTELGNIASNYGQLRYQGDDKKVSACKSLYKDSTMKDAAKAQQMWHSLIEPDTNKDKMLGQLNSRAKVLFLKLRIKYKKLKGLKLRDKHTEEADGTDGPSNHAAEGEEHNNAKTGVRSGLYSIAMPEAVPIWTWIKNMSTLLMSEPWLTGEHLRREAVCTLLALDNTLLDSRHSILLKDWVINNRPVVNVLNSHSLQDRLSKALVDCLTSTSTENWKRKILMSFQGAPSKSARLLDQTTRIKRVIKRNPSARHVQDKQLQHTTAVKQDRTYDRNKQSTCKSRRGYEEKEEEEKEEEEYQGCNKDEDKEDMLLTSKPFGTKFNKKAQARESQIHKQPTREADLMLYEAMEATSDNEEWDQEWDKEAEYEIPGEDLEATMHRDNIESSDEYDYSDKFIDDGSTDEDCSSDEEEDEEAFCVQQKRRRAVRRVKRVSHSKSEEEEEDNSRQLGFSGDTKEDTGLYKRTLSSSSDEESIKQTVKRLKCVNDRCVKEKLIRAERETSVPCAKREEKTGKRHNVSKRSKIVKLKKNTSTRRKRDSPPYKDKRLVSETDELEVHWGGVNANIKFNPYPGTQVGQEKRRLHSKTQKVKPENSLSQKRETIEQGKRQESLRNYPVAKASRLSPVITQSQVPRLQSKAANLANLTKQAVWPSYHTLESDQEDQRNRDGKVEQIDSEDTSTHLHESTSEDEDSVLGPERLDIRSDKTGTEDETETDSDDNHSVRVHLS